MSEAVAVARERFSLRSGKPEDENFIFATWLRAYKHASSFARHIERPTFFKYHQAVIRRILDRGAAVTICTPGDDRDVILGYSITEPGILHFVYVKKPFRRLGIASSLIAEVGPQWVFTHATDDWRYLQSTRQMMQYNPYLI